MLVLSRKIGEQIIIGEGANRVIITIVDINYNKMRVGIKAAKEIPIHRSELLEPPEHKSAT